jgi:hypothetical protein
MPSQFVQGKTMLSPATVIACLDQMVSIGLVRELTGKRRNRVYAYSKYIEIMSSGTELPE